MTSARPLQFKRSGFNVTLRKAEGFALIDMIFVTGIMGLLMSLAMPRLLLARQSASAASAIGSMRAIGSAQLTYALTCGSGFYAPSLTTLGMLPPGSTQPFISTNLTMADTVVKTNYTIQMTATAFPSAPASCNLLPAGAGGQAYVAGADPINPGNTRFFAINASNAIYEHDASLYATMPEVGAPPIGHILR
jgi:type II secretory pathway pseudopilin PulG